MGKYCDRGKNRPRIMTDLQVFSPLEYEKLHFGMLPLCLYLYTWMCASLAPEGLVGFYYNLIFDSLSAIGRCLLNINILTPETGAFRMGPKTKWRLSRKLL
jgi:hypothetical protein